MVKVKGRVNLRFILYVEVGILSQEDSWNLDDEGVRYLRYWIIWKFLSRSVVRNVVYCGVSMVGINYSMFRMIGVFIRSYFRVVFIIQGQLRVYLRGIGKGEKEMVSRF